MRLPLGYILIDPRPIQQNKIPEGKVIWYNEKDIGFGYRGPKQNKVCILSLSLCSCESGPCF